MKPLAAGAAACVTLIAAIGSPVAAGEPAVWPAARLAQLSEPPSPVWLSAPTPFPEGAPCAENGLAPGPVVGRYRALSFHNVPYPRAGAAAVSVFALLGVPEGASSAAPRPAVVLAHGGEGRAFCDWVKLWVRRGFVAIALNQQGQAQDPVTFEQRPFPAEDGGPPLAEEHATGAVATGRDDDVWIVHAASNVLKARAFLASLPEVDENRIGLEGMSYGGYTALMAASLDDRFAAAVAVYGAGYQHEGGYWAPVIAALDDVRPGLAARWVARYDPSRYVGQASVPMLMLNGVDEPYYTFEIQQRTADAYGGPLTRTSLPRLAHGVAPAVSAPEPGRFLVSRLSPGSVAALPQLIEARRKGGRASARFQLAPGAAFAEARLLTAAGTGPWPERVVREVKCGAEEPACRVRVVGDVVEVRARAPKNAAVVINMSDDQLFEGASAVVSTPLLPARPQAR